MLPSSNRYSVKQFKMMPLAVWIALGMLVPLTIADNIQYQIRRGEKPSRGVNLGGWLVAERWMTYNSIIYKDIEDNEHNKGEYRTMQALVKKFGRAEANRRFDEHRKTWITENDIAQIARAGLNTVRVPVGYWIAGFDKQDPPNRQAWKKYAPGGLRYLDKLIRIWAVKYKLAVMISIHAAKGSQNGEHHSSPEVPGQVYWKKSQYPENIANTIDLAWFLAKRYKKDKFFLGIGLLNEPSNAVSDDDLRYYYNTVHHQLRKFQKNDCVLTHAPRLHDQGPWNRQHSGWPDFGKPSEGYVNYWHEWHKYLVWGFDGKKEDWIMNQGVAAVKTEIDAWKGNWLFIGEWSLASPGSAPFSDAAKHRQYGLNMLNALKGAHSGWTFWAWKVDGDGGVHGWSLRSLLRSNIMKIPAA